MVGFEVIFISSFLKAYLYFSHISPNDHVFVKYTYIRSSIA